MTLRLFVVVTVFIVALILNGVLIGFEHTPEAVEVAEDFVVEDRHKDMVWSVGTRRTNAEAFNLPSEMVDKIEARIAEMAKRDRKGDVLEALKAASDMTGQLCSNTSALPSRYFVTGLLLEGERGTRRDVAKFNQIRAKLSLQEGYRPGDLEDMYQATEMQPNPSPDAYALNMMALLFGEEFERVNGEDDWGDGFFGPPDIRSLLNRRAEVYNDMVEFFASSHYLHEVARDPANEFCGVRAGVSFTPDGE